MVKRLSKHHYLATPGQSDPYLNSRPYLHQSVNRGYSTDGEDSQRAGSERTMSEYIISNERISVMGATPPPKKPRSKRSRSHEHIPSRASSRSKDRGRNYDDSSDIYVTSGAYRAPSEISRGSRYSHHSRAPSRYSYTSGPPISPSEVSVKSKVSRKPGVTVETMSAPNPFCPNTKGICCLMLLLNLGLILVALGFVIVVQFFEPLFVWILGVIFLVFGFLTLMGSLIYCVYVFRDARTPKQVAAQDHYWTHHWQKSFGTTPPSEIYYKTEKYQHPAHPDHYSDRRSSKY